MSADLERLLHAAAGPPPGGLDLERLEAVAGRRRRRRRAAGALGVLAVLAAVVAVVPVLVQPRVAIDAPAEPGGWPVLVAYTETRLDEGWAHDWEVAARGWSSWTMVEGPRVALDDTGAAAEEVAFTFGEAFAREGDRRWVGTPFHLDAVDREGAFDLVEDLLIDRWSERFDVDADPDGEQRWRPLVAFTPEPAGPDDVAAEARFADDVPDRRADVGERLGLDPDALVGFMVERDDGTLVTWVRHAATGVPLYYEQAVEVPTTGDEAAFETSVRIAATEVRFDAELPERTGPDPAEPPDEDADVVEPSQPEVAVAGDWRTLAAAPVGGRFGAGAVWTGSELLVWGGVPQAAGAAYDPAADAWRTLPDAPIDPRDAHVTVWTGDELLVWGGGAYDEPDDPDEFRIGADFGQFRADGAAYDPAADTWRVLADAPLEPRAGAAGVWTGSELVIVAGTGEGADPGTTTELVDGAAYDPAVDAWRAIPDLPDLEHGSLREVGADAVWTGAELLVGGSRFAPGISAAYNPAADAWRVIDDGPPAGGGGFVAWTGSEAILADTMAVDADGQAGQLYAYDVDADTWRDLPAPPVDVLHAVTFVAADRLLALGGLADHDDTAPMGAWILDPAGEHWHPLDDAPIGDRGQPAALWTGTELLVWSGTAIATGDEAAVHHDGAAWRPSD